MLSRLLTRKEQLILMFLVSALLVGSVALWWNHHRASRISIVHEQESIVNLPEQKPAPDSGTATPDSQVPLSCPLAGTNAPEQAAAQTAPQTGEITINVEGAVAKPGVVKLPAGSVVEDAVTAAGGYSSDADPARINRAAKLIDGTTLNVPAKSGMQTSRDSSPVLRIPPPVTNIPEYLPGYVPQAERQEAVQQQQQQATPSRSPKININTATADELQTLPGIGPKLSAAIIQYRNRRPFHTIEEIQDVPQIGAKRFAQIKDLITVSGD